MKITKIVEEQQGVDTYRKKGMSSEQLQREYDYFLSEKILKTMLENGLINQGECDKITKLNRQTFSPFLAEIMP